MLLVFFCCEIQHFGMLGTSLHDEIPKMIVTRGAAETNS
jgi:hypothetical protein